MTRPDVVLSEFIDAWNAGRRPSVREHLLRVPEADWRSKPLAANCGNTAAKRGRPDKLNNVPRSATHER